MPNVSNCQSEGGPPEPLDDVPQLTEEFAACALQDCLGANTYTPEKCNTQIRKLYECCEKMYAANPEAQSSPCPMRSVGKRWLAQHSVDKERQR